MQLATRELEKLGDVGPYQNSIASGAGESIQGI
jgi:hypothetical protein